MTKNIEEKTYEEMTKSERRTLFREVERDCSVSARTTETAGAWVPEWTDEWIAEFLPNHSSLKKDPQ